jgi:hypothetical protein
VLQHLHQGVLDRARDPQPRSLPDCFQQTVLRSLQRCFQRSVRSQPSQDLQTRIENDLQHCLQGTVLQRFKEGKFVNRNLKNVIGSFLPVVMILIVH